MKKFISLNEPLVGNPEIINLNNCIRSNWITSGKYIENFEKKISLYTKSSYVVMCSNCSVALYIALKILGIEAKDEVITPTLTFVAPINAIILCGASPIFMDADKYHSIDIEKTIDFINKETFFKSGFSYNKRSKKKIKAILAVHVWGNAAKLHELVDICKEKNIEIIEDAAESFGTKYTTGNLKGKYTGTVGKIGCLSFNGNKIITSGGGGAILTNSKKLADEARYYINQAKDNKIRYIHNEVGYNFRISNLHAAVGYAQLQKINFLLKKKKEINEFYKKSLLNQDGIRLLENPKYSKNNFWMNVITINKSKYKQSINYLLKKFKNNNIEIKPVWYLNHLQKSFKKYQNYKIENAIEILNSSLCLPSSCNLKSQDILRIAKLF